MALPTKAVGKSSPRSFRRRRLVPSLHVPPVHSRVSRLGVRLASWESSWRILSPRATGSIHVGFPVGQARKSVRVKTFGGPHQDFPNAALLTSTPSLNPYLLVPGPSLVYCRRYRRPSLLFGGPLVFVAVYMSSCRASPSSRQLTLCYVCSVQPLTRTRRQHFQGLRRAQHKAALNGEANPAVPRTTDPAINPITRRPGPGRGRPRKNAANAAARAGVGAGATAAAAPNPADGTAPANLAGSVPAGGAASGDVSAAASQVPVTVVQQTPVPLPPTVAVNTDAKVGVGVEGVEDVGVVGEVGEDDVDTSGMEPPSAKRARLDYQAPAPQPQAQGAEEEAVLALAAHTTSEDAYAEEYASPMARNTRTL